MVVATLSLSREEIRSLSSCLLNAYWLETDMVCS
jgi:hypothetical protein